MSSSAFLDNLRQLFDECDADKNGCLTRDEFDQLCAKIGLGKQASEETFNRLDTDGNECITFDTFIAGFNRYQQMSPPTSPVSSESSPKPRSYSEASTHQAANDSQQPQLTVNLVSSSGSRSTSPVRRSPVASRRNQRLSPVTSRALKNSIGSNGSSYVTSRFGSGSGEASGSGDSTSLGAGSSTSGLQTYESNLRASSAEIERDANMVVYSGDMLTGNDYASQRSSLLSNSGSLNNQSALSMHDLLECVQRLQEENQILSKIFFKDKREREEYISQLGEEFDQQVREVEERANRRAREELENEKKRLREMMKAERETLQHHYKTIERMGKIIKSNNEEKCRLEDDESIVKVKSKLEDTFMENRQLKKSLLDTKTDVALIWREMEKLKRQYEEKLSSAYERNQETKSECDHIKQQLSLMKDSNRKLQDASDVITNYIADRVDPVIKIATGENGDQDFPSLTGYQSTGKLAVSQTNSRRGSVLSDYLGNDTVELSLDSQAQSNNQTNQTNSLNSVELESLANNESKTNETDKEKEVKPSLTPPGENLKRSQSHQQQLNQTTEAGERKVFNEEPRSLSSLKTTFSRSFFSTSPAKIQPTIDQSVSTNVRNDNSKHEDVLTKSTSPQTDSDYKLIEPPDGSPVAVYDIVLVGDSFVGKSSLASRFVDGSYKKNLISTTSIDFNTKDCKVDGVNYTINLWDTA